MRITFLENATFGKDFCEWNQSIAKNMSLKDKQ